MRSSIQGRDAMTLQVPAFWLALLSLGLAACGGGGGSGPANSGQSQTPAGYPSISLDPATTSFTTDRVAPVAISNVVLTLHNTTTASVFISADYTKRGITGVGANSNGPTSINLVPTYRPPQTLFNGTYTDQVTFHACLDQACGRELNGSPLAITLTYTLTGTDPVTGQTGPLPDPDATALQVQSRIALTHDVLDAEYSRTLDRIVMVATYPADALYIYDVATGTEKSVPLSKVPTAVSISPDGLTAAVGHDALVSVVDLAEVEAGRGLTPLRVNVSVKVFDLALDGQRRVHIIPDTDQEARIHTIDLATGTDQVSPFNQRVFGQTYIRLHPSGSSLFVGDPLLSPSTMDKWDITGPAAVYMTKADFDMAYLGACGNMWFNESGSQVYSQCGPVFSSAAPPNTWLSPLGRLELSGPTLTTDHYTIAWMDQFAARHEIALIEANAAWCKHPGFRVPCYHRLAISDSDTFARHSLHALAPIAVDGMFYQQQGLLVFYRSDGSKYLLSRLDAISNPVAEYYLSLLE